MLGQVGVNRFDYTVGNGYTTRPAAAFGTSVTPGASNAMGSYSASMATLTKDCYYIVVNFNSGKFAGEARDILADIGIDPAGGTSYSVLLPNLLASNACDYDTFEGGIWYQFPIFIPSGSTIACRAQVNAATARTLRCAIWCMGGPTHPHLIRWGTRCEAIGVTTASSSGTAVTSGTTNEGAWTSLGTSANRNFYYQMGFGINDLSIVGNTYHLDLAADNNATTPKIIMRECVSNSNTNENLTLVQPEGWMSVPASTTIYGRIQCDGTADSSLSMAAYGVS